MGIKRALISVYDKDGWDRLAAGLVDHGVHIVSTGNTYRHIKSLGLPVTPIEDVTDFPEILGGRVKSLHPKIHGGILADRRHMSHMEQLADHDITPIDLVVVNLYPFSETVTRPGSTHQNIVEMIDIGGPAMIRAAAKNYPDVVVVTDPRRYEDVLTRLVSGEPFDMDFRLALALEAFQTTTEYDGHIQRYLAERTAQRNDELPERIVLVGSDGKSLKYGENPHQKAAFYRDATYDGVTIADARQLHGTPLSYNNIMDAAAALEMVQAFDGPTAVAVKHANPCGLATAETLDEAFRKVEAADPVSIFGGIVACNRQIDEETARHMARIFLEVVVAPDFHEDALNILRGKKNLRILRVGQDGTAELERARPYWDMRRIAGGFLVQNADVDTAMETDHWQVVTERHPTEEQMKDIVFGWRAVKFVKSNAIAIVKNRSLIGVGAGQMNRVQSARIALEHAGDQAPGSVLASDAFFPFPDVVEAAAEKQVAAIVQPGGSIRDEQSVEAADAAGIAMLFTGRRHFRH